MKHKFKMLVGLGFLIVLAQGKTIRNRVIDWMEKQSSYDALG